jgi:hypothetical protein
MKKVIYFLMLMSAMTILNIGCEKPDDNDTTITAANLVGTWNFTSLETFNQTGTVLIKKYVLPTDLIALTNEFNYGALKLTFGLPNTIKIYDLCSNDPTGYADGTFSININQITCSGPMQFGTILFKIKELNSGKTILKLQMLSSSVVVGTPSSSAVYTFSK